MGMCRRADVIDIIRQAFSAGEYPGDEFLQGSFDGCEPFEAVGRFQGQDNWEALKPAHLDADAAVIGFFSEAAFRFYLPAYLIADLSEELERVDILFHLTHGFSEGEVKIPLGTELFVRKFGRSAFVNPRRYGAMTWVDYARYRLSIFPREEAQAIVAYLETKRDFEQIEGRRVEIEAALQEYWLDRAARAPLAASLQQHIAEEASYLAAIDAGTPA